jgi:hypothetical protein
MATDDCDDWLVDDDDNGTADQLPADPEALFTLIRDLTARLLDFYYDWEVCGQAASGEVSRADRLRHLACKALGERANEAIDAGAQDFAASFDAQTREIFLGTSLQRETVMTEHRLRFSKWLSEHSDTGSA